MQVEHFDPKTKQTTMMEQDLKYPNPPGKDASDSEKYSYWAWRYSSLGEQFRKAPRTKARQNLRLEVDKAQREYNRAKGKLFG